MNADVCSSECLHSMCSACRCEDCACRCHIEEDSEYDMDYGLEDDDEDEYYDCGWDPSGGCSMAGSEECDFECPNRDSMIAALERKRK